MENSEKTHMKTLSSCMNKLKEDGYKEEFKIKENKLCCIDCDNEYLTSQVKICSFYRFEGESDPSDSAIVYAIETHDGKMGLIVDAYGAYADPEIGKFIVEVEEINKKAHEEKC